MSHRKHRTYTTTNQYRKNYYGIEIKEALKKYSGIFFIYACMCLMFWWNGLTQSAVATRANYDQLHLAEEATTQIIYERLSGSKKNYSQLLETWYEDQE